MINRIDINQAIWDHTEIAGTPPKYLVLSNAGKMDIYVDSHDWRAIGIDFNIGSESYHGVTMVVEPQLPDNQFFVCDTVEDWDGKSHTYEVLVMSPFVTAEDIVVRFQFTIP